jgi:hypothetical protein
MRGMLDWGAGVGRVRLMVASVRIKNNTQLHADRGNSARPSATFNAELQMPFYVRFRKILQKSEQNASLFRKSQPTIAGSLLFTRFFPRIPSVLA